MQRMFAFGRESSHGLTWTDIAVLAAIGALLYAGARLAVAVPAEIQGPEISLAPSALPWYALLSTGRMTLAYFLSLAFSLFYGRVAARNRNAGRVMLPILDVLQSVPILSFLPVVLLSLTAILPDNTAAELASIVLIFTSQAWNLTFAWYQSQTTQPKELQEASGIFRLNGWMRFRKLELPFGAIGLIWNSIMSWAGGWFFLMAAETFTVGARDFRLPGIGSYLQEAAAQSDLQAVVLGLATLVLVIVLLDQFVWRPLLAWSDRFKVQLVEDDEPPTSWFYDAWSVSRVAEWVNEGLIGPLSERIDAFMLRRFPFRAEHEEPSRFSVLLSRLVLLVIAAGLSFLVFRAGQTLLRVPAAEWLQLLIDLLATLLRVIAALVLAFAWTVPVGVVIGTNRRWATVLQPLVQVAASIPATALFPVILLFFLRLPQGLNLAAVLLMLLGTQWYVLFNVIAGASAIPQDLKNTSALLQLDRTARWRTLILPALFPFLVTGAITASGGAWNASIVAEHVEYGGQTLYVRGIGASIAEATARGDNALLLASTLAMVVTVVLINRFVWRRFYRLAEGKYRLE